LLIPEGITDRLTPAQLGAVLAHLWWIRSRLLEERERACDEEVLLLGSEPQVYAEGILNIYRLYAESPLVCYPESRGRISVNALRQSWTTALQED
jgi:hypothetical protein